MSNTLCREAWCPRWWWRRWMGWAACPGWPPWPCSPPARTWTSSGQNHNLSALATCLHLQSVSVSSLHPCLYSHAGTWWRNLTSPAPRIKKSGSKHSHLNDKFTHTKETAQKKTHILYQQVIDYYVEKQFGVVLKWIVNNKLGPFQQYNYAFLLRILCLLYYFHWSEVTQCSLMSSKWIVDTAWS